jgi:hypothetical protein
VDDGLGLSTLLVDLLTPEEGEIDKLTAHLRFNIPLLASRLGDITDFICATEGAGIYTLLVYTGGSSNTTIYS